MKTVLVLLTTIYVVYVTSETCNEQNFNKYTDCPSEVCGTNMEKACQRGICTCMVSDTHACLSQSDCLTFNGFATNCTGLNYHNHPDNGTVWTTSVIVPEVTAITVSDPHVTSGLCVKCEAGRE